MEAKKPVPRRRGLLAALALPHGSSGSGGDTVCPQGRGTDIPMQVGQPVQLALLVPGAPKAEGFLGFLEGSQPRTMGDVPSLPQAVTFARTRPED